MNGPNEFGHYTSGKEIARVDTANGHLRVSKHDVSFTLEHWFIEPRDDDDDPIEEDGYYFWGTVELTDAEMRKLVFAVGDAE